MSRSPLPMEAPHRWMLLFSGVILAVIAVVAGLWLTVGDGRKTGGGGSGSDETTPGTALIALSRGYERDGETENLAKVRYQALALAQNPTTPLPVRVTTLSIAGDGGGEEVKQLAGKLVGSSETPAILKKVAERVVKNS